MKLYPKARPVRIKLSVGGEEHSSLDSLRRCFDVEEVLKLYENGGLKNWLRQIRREDLLDAMKNIEEKNNIVERYEECIKIFFEKNDVGDNLETVLMEWYNTEPTNFKLLLDHIKPLPVETYSISVVNAKKIVEDAKRRKDKDTLVFINNYFFLRLKPKFEQLKDLYFNTMQSYSSSKNDEEDLEKSKNNYNLLLAQICKEWDITQIDSHKTSKILSNVVEQITATDIINYRKKELEEIVAPLLVDANTKPLTQKLKAEDLSAAELFRDNVCKFASRIHKGYFSSSQTSDYIITVTFSGLQPSSIIFRSNWGEMCEILRRFSNQFYCNSTTKLFNNLLSLFIYVYLCYCAMGNLEDKTHNAQIELKSLRGNLNVLGGKKELTKIPIYIYKSLKRELDKVTTEPNKAILQCALFISVLSFGEVEGMAEKELKKRYLNELKKNYLNELVEQRYRPAQLYAGTVQPHNSLEYEFIGLNDVEKMRFVAEHILEF
ncbi:MAG: hypothetical protein K2J63_10880 [Muribaculaceae bacterium]|nr:hypothetical protein [Muribaculaceae bacterium]